MRFQSERFLEGMVEPGTGKEYPAFTGTEPCSTIGNDFFCDDMEHQYDEILFAACNKCPLIKECFNWALHNEPYFYWGASTAADRKKLRKKYNIVIDERWIRSA